MGEPSQGSDKHAQWLDDEIVRDPSDEEESTNPQLWEAPGHDGIVGRDETDPDRTDLRAQIGQYVSLVHFPAAVKEMIATAQDGDAPDEVLEQLRRLDPDATYANTADLWEALGLRSEPRF